MFVRKSTYEAMFARALAAEAAYIHRNNEWNRLVRRINKLGGEAFLQGRTRPVLQPFTADELRSLIQLCHPDKHGGKQVATEITAKLLKLKEAAQ